MKRIIPDIINCKPLDNFTQVRNSILRDNKISLKAKGLLALLLSNKDGWYSYAETIKSFSTDGDTSIRSALKELEDNYYLLRLRYRDKDDKKIKGGFWAYTDIPGEFNLDSTLLLLKNNNMELMPRITEKAICGEPPRGKAKTNNTNIKNTNYSSVSDNSKLTEIETQYKQKIEEQIKEVLSIPELQEIVTPAFIKEMEEYSPSKNELSYFIENFGYQPIDYYKEYLIWAILEEQLYSPDKEELVIPRIALLNKNVVRRQHLYDAMNNSEDILFSLKSICKKEENMIDKEGKEEFFKKNVPFSNFLSKNKELLEKEKEKEENSKQIEFEFLENLHKLDNKNFDYIDEDDVDSYIESLLN